MSNDMQQKIAVSTMQSSRTHYLEWCNDMTIEELRDIYARTQAAEERLAGTIHLQTRMFAIGKRAALRELIRQKETKK